MGLTSAPHPPSRPTKCNYYFFFFLFLEAQILLEFWQEEITAHFETLPGPVDSLSSPFEGTGAHTMS